MGQYELAFPTDERGECMAICFPIYEGNIYSGFMPVEFIDPGEDVEIPPVYEEEVCYNLCDLEDRVDYLDAYCRSINAYRGD